MVVAAGAVLLAATGVAPNEKLLLGASGFDPGLGVSQATHLAFSGSFRTIQASHSHLLEPVSLKAFPKPEVVVVVPLPTAGVTGLASASKQLPDFNSGTTGLPFRASKQLPLFSGKGSFGVEGVVGVEAGAAAFGLAISGLNWNPPSLREVIGAELLPLPLPIGSGSLNLKSFLALEIRTAAALADTVNFAGDENLYTLLLLLVLTEESSVSAEVAATGLVLGFSDGFDDDDDIGNLMSNLGTDFNPASCTSGRFTCGTGALLPRSECDSSRIRCNLLRILLVCFTLLLLSSASTFGSL